jgi:hypothetical protein
MTKIFKALKVTERKEGRTDFEEEVIQKLQNVLSRPNRYLTLVNEMNPAQMMCTGRGGHGTFSIEPQKARKPTNDAQTK